MTQCVRCNIELDQENVCKSWIDGKPYTPYGMHMCQECADSFDAWIRRKIG